MDQHPKELVTTGEVRLRSILHEGALYPAFVISTDTEELKADLVEDLYDRFYYAPFRDIVVEDSAKATIRASFALDATGGDEPTHSVVLSASSLLAVMSTMGQDRLQMPYVVVDSSEVSEEDNAIGSECIVFTTGMPAREDPQFHTMVEKFQDTLGFQVDSRETDEDGIEVITVTPAMMEAASQAFASTYLISQGDSGPLMDLIARRDFIDQAQQIVDSEDNTLDDDERMEAEVFVEMPNVLFSTYHVSANSFLLLEDIAESSSSEDEDSASDENPSDEQNDPFGSLAEGLLNDILASIDPEDEDQPDQLRARKIMSTWQESPLDSTISAMTEVRKSLEIEQGYRDVLNASFETTEDLTAAIEIYGRGRVIVALMVLIADRAVKFSQLDRINEPGELSNNDMFNLLQWFDPFGGQFAWKWLALARPLQNYDVTLVEKILRFEQSVTAGKDLGENQVVVPTSMVHLAQNVVGSTLVLKEWKGYDFSNLAEDAMSLEVNIPGFREFAMWLQQLISESRRIYEGSSNDLSVVFSAVEDFIISESLGDPETAAWRVSMALPVLSELCPSVSRYKVGSVQHIRERKEFISAHLMNLAMGG